VPVDQDGFVCDEEGAAFSASMTVAELHMCRGGLADADDSTPSAS